MSFPHLRFQGEKSLLLASERKCLQGQTAEIKRESLKTNYGSHNHKRQTLMVSLSTDWPKFLSMRRRSSSME